ncbi:MAG TPA: hypothetical protein VGJ20_06830 [Xanthobacteraceae bacterium]|jgi:hypothetical protein
MTCLIEGEAIATDEAGLAVFELLRSWRHDHIAVLVAFDLIELGSEDLRQHPIEDRKARPDRLLPKPFRGSILLNWHDYGDGGIERPGIHHSVPRLIQNDASLRGTNQDKPDTSGNKLRQRARCSVCGHKGRRFSIPLGRTRA